MIFDAIVPAGGRATRLGGLDKAQLTAGGESLLDIALRAAGAARTTVVVGGPDLPVPGPVLLVREDPPFGGPVAAVAAGMTRLPLDPADWVLLLAVDQPGSRALVTALLAAAELPTAAGVQALIGVDDAGRRQWLAGLYRPGPLAAALRRGDPAGRSMRALAADLAVREVLLPATAVGDVDTPAELTAWQLSRRSDPAGQ